MCSRHAGSVAAHRRCAATFASDRPPCRLSDRYISFDGISAVVEIPLYHLPIRKHFSNQIVLSGRTGGGVFFERKRRKKAHRTGRPKRELTFRLQKCQHQRTGRPKHVLTSRQLKRRRNQHQPLGANTDKVNLDTQLVRPWSSVMSICQTWVLRPMCTGLAMPFTQPLGTPRIWLALISKPTMP